MKLTNPELIVKRSYKEVYKDGDKIVKIFEKDHPKSAVFNEALNTVRVEEAGLDIPKLDEVTQIDEKWALVIECQAGETLETVMEKDPDNLEKYLPYFDAVLLENHGALTWSTDLNAAYMKMESVEFYAQLLYQAKMLGGPKPLSEEQVQRLYEIRRKFGMKGKHPADLCPNAKAGKPSCHSCGGNCSCGTVSSTAANDAALIAEITKKVLASLS